MNPWLGMALVGGILVALMGLLRLWQALASPHPELVRKGLHAGMGLVTLTFPWVFDSPWPVLSLAALSVVGLSALRVVQGLKKGLGGVISGVARESLGEIYFPAAVALLFALFLREKARGEASVVLYCVPVLLLTLADAAAALVGVRYGLLRFSTADGVKSAEGSAAFITCAFFCVHVPLLLLTNIGRPETLLIALLLAWLAMMFEAISWGGLDNFLIPLVSFALLKSYLGLSVRDLILRIAIVGGLTVALALYRRRTTLMGNAVVGAVLFGYVTWALEGWHWVVAPVILLVSYGRLSPRTEENSRQIHNVHAVISVASAGLIWLFLAHTFHREDFLFPYTLSFAAHLSIIGVARLRYDYPRMSTSSLLGFCIGAGWLLIFLPYLVFEGFTLQRMTWVIISIAGVAAAAMGFYWSQPGIDDCPIDGPRWMRQAINAGLGSLAGLLPLF